MTERTHVDFAVRGDLEPGIGLVRAVVAHPGGPVRARLHRRGGDGAEVPL